jgi:chromosome segregation ATPase
MKAVLRRMLSAVGLTTARRAERLEMDARQAVLRSRALEERVAAMQADVERWKRRCEDKSAAASGWKQAAGEIEARARTDTARLKAHCEELKARVADLASEVNDLQGRLEAADRAASSAREELMLMETKLDLVEAAIRILDARTREGAVSG